MKPHQKRQLAQQAKAVVGIDAGKFHHALVVRPRGGADSKAVTIENTRTGYEAAVQAIHRTAPTVAPHEVLVGIEFAGNSGFTLAHYLHQQGFHIVSVLPAHTKRWKDVMHNQALKTDAKDALGITDLAAQGHFVSFPFLKPEFAELRYLSSARQRVSLLRRADVSRLKNMLQVVWPEFEKLFCNFTVKTPLAVLAAYPGPDELLQAPAETVKELLRVTSRNHKVEATYEALLTAAQGTIALPVAQGALREEIPLVVERLRLFDRQLKAFERQLRIALSAVPEAQYVMTVPKVAPATAAVFLGSIGDPQAYESSKQILKLAGLSLVERSSGILKGEKRISKRGRPMLRQFAYMFAVRHVRKDGIFRTQYEALLARNGGKPIPALTAIARDALRLLYRVARDQRPYVPAALWR
jgi:transposase